MKRVLIGIVAVLVILTVVFVIGTFVSYRSGGESPVTTVSTAVPSPTVSQ